MLFFFLSLSPSLSPSFATFDELFVVRAECIYQSRVWSVTRRELSRRKCERLSAKTETRAGMGGGGVWAGKPIRWRVYTGESSRARRYYFYTSATQIYKNLFAARRK